MWKCRFGYKDAPFSRKRKAVALAIYKLTSNVSILLQISAFFKYQLFIIEDSLSYPWLRQCLPLHRTTPSLHRVAFSTSQLTSCKIYSKVVGCADETFSTTTDYGRCRKNAFWAHHTMCYRLHFAPASCNSSQKIILLAYNKSVRFIAKTFPWEVLDPSNPLRYRPVLHFQVTVVNITGEAICKYRIDFSFSSQLRTDFGSSRYTRVILDLLAAHTLPYHASRSFVKRTFACFPTRNVR